MNIQLAVIKGTNILKSRSIQTAQLDAEILMAKVLGSNREYIILNNNKVIEDKHNQEAKDNQKVHKNNKEKKPNPEPSARQSNVTTSNISPKIWETSFPCFQWKEIKQLNMENGKYIYSYVNKNGIVQMEVPKDTGYIREDGRIIFPEKQILDMIYPNKESKTFQITNKIVKEKIPIQQTASNETNSAESFDDHILLNMSSYY